MTYYRTVAVFRQKHSNMAAILEKVFEEKINSENLIAWLRKRDAVVSLSHTYISYVFLSSCYVSYFTFW